MRRCCCKPCCRRRFFCSPCYTNFLLKIIVKLLILIVLKLWCPGRVHEGLEDELAAMQAEIENPEMDFEEE